MLRVKGLYSVNNDHLPKHSHIYDLIVSRITLYKRTHHTNGRSYTHTSSLLYV